MKAPRTRRWIGSVQGNAAAVVWSSLIGDAPGDAAPPPSAWGPVFESDDCDRMREYVSGFFCDFALEQIGRARHHLIRHRQARFGSLRVHEFEHMQTAGELRLSAPALPGLCLFELNLAGGAILCDDQRDVPFGAGQFCVVNADEPHRKRWHASNRRIILGVEQALLEQHAAEMIGRTLRTPLRFGRQPRPIDRSTAALAMSVGLICADLDGGAGLAGRRAVSSAERLFVELLIDTVPNSYSRFIERQAPAVRPGYLKRVIDFVHENADDAIGPVEMAGVAGVSARTLYDAFRRHCGVSPMAYLRSVRLESARDALAARARAGASVTEVALDCGFSHVGKFARAYRKRYGELPSVTLRRHR
jgi:AraC-like DNA-binding protein